jgi:hypothetical protein
MATAPLFQGIGGLSCESQQIPFLIQSIWIIIHLAFIFEVSLRIQHFALAFLNEPISLELEAIRCPGSSLEARII